MVASLWPAPRCSCLLTKVLLTPPSQGFHLHHEDAPRMVAPIFHVPPCRVFALSLSRHDGLAHLFFIARTSQLPPKMPRPRVDPRFRRRVARACETCKRRKEKCNGALPCDQCKSRLVDRACCYTRCPPSAGPQGDDKARSRTPGREVRVDLTVSGVQSPAPSPDQAKVDVPVVRSSPHDRGPQTLKLNREKFSTLNRLCQVGLSLKQTPPSIRRRIRHPGLPRDGEKSSLRRRGLLCVYQRVFSKSHD